MASAAREDRPARVVSRAALHVRALRRIAAPRGGRRRVLRARAHRRHRGRAGAQDHGSRVVSRRRASGTARLRQRRDPALRVAAPARQGGVRARRVSVPAAILHDGAPESGLRGDPRPPDRSDELSPSRGGDGHHRPNWRDRRGWTTSPAGSLSLRRRSREPDQDTAATPAAPFRDDFLGALTMTTSSPDQRLSKGEANLKALSIATRIMAAPRQELCSSELTWDPWASDSRPDEPRPAAYGPGASQWDVIAASAPVQTEIPERYRAMPDAELADRIAR